MSDSHPPSLDWGAGAGVRIALLEPLHPAAHALLETAGEVRLAAVPDEREAVRLAAGADAVLTRGRGPITAAALAAGARLRIVARCGVGLDNVDVAAASARGIPVVYAPGMTTATVAEHTLLLLLAAARRLPALDAVAKAGHWSARQDYQGRELGGKTLGVVGLGAIGRRVASLAVAFGMRVVAWSPHSRDDRYEFLELDDLLTRVDMVSLHLALVEGTRGLIDRRRLALMPPGAILVNTARGALVDEKAIAAALRTGRLGAYATDVLAREPPAPDTPLLSAPNAIVTPHSAGLTDRAYEAMCTGAAANVLRVLRGDQPELGCVANLDAVRQRYGW